MAAALQRCWKIAEQQHGVLTRAQAIKAGLGRGRIAARIRAGSWERLLPSVYRMAGSPRGFIQLAWAATLFAGRGSALGFEAAAELHGFPRLAAQTVWIVTPRDLRVDDLRIRRVRTLDKLDVRFIDGLPVTSPARTLIDLCDAGDADDVRAVLEHLLRTKGVTLEEIRRARARIGRPRGWGTLERLLQAFEAGAAVTESEAEAVMRELLEDWELPLPTQQRAIKLSGKLRRLDFAWDPGRVVVEVDGLFWHWGQERSEDDRRRRNALTAAGWRVFQATWSSLHDEPQELYRQISPLLGKASAS